jgi:hypothetical protein
MDETNEEKKRRLRRVRNQKWRSKPDVKEKERKRANRLLHQVRLQAGRAFVALQNALSGPAPSSMAEASRQMLLRAEANMEAAQLQVKITQLLANSGYIKLESTEMREFMAQVSAKWPSTTDFS